MQTRKNISMHK